MDKINKIRKKHGLELYAKASRKCLKCKINFDSWDKKNRICLSCKEANNGKLGKEFNFSPESNFQYDFTISELIETKHKGLELNWNKNYKK